MAKEKGCARPTTCRQRNLVTLVQGGLFRLNGKGGVLDWQLGKGNKGSVKST